MPSGDGSATRATANEGLDVSTHQQAVHRTNGRGEEIALGLLIIDYTYPTQPGDIDDKRSFCSMKAGNYTCIDNFGLVKSKVQGLTFEAAQQNIWNEQVRQNFESALKALLVNPRVLAITGNCGFFAHYQTRADDYMTELVRCTGNTSYWKPIRLSTLSLLRSLVNAPAHGGWALQEPTDQTLVVTANKQALNPSMHELMQKLKVSHMSHDNKTLKDFLHNATHEDGSGNISQEVIGDSRNATEDIKLIYAIHRMSARGKTRSIVLCVRFFF